MKIKFCTKEFYCLLKIRAYKSRKLLDMQGISALKIYVKFSFISATVMITLTIKILIGTVKENKIWEVLQ